jgi:hypothetical protein
MNSIDFAIVHHANQYLITNGYQNREGLNDVIDSYVRIIELHRTYKLPLNIHLSGTLMEAILWHSPGFFDSLRDLREHGLIDFIGSSYGQNVMRFFKYHHNFRQLNEELRLYREQLGADPKEVRVFWPPERLWDTEKLAHVLTDKKLMNKGHKYVLIDDRLFYPARRGMPSRSVFDRGRVRSCADFHPCRIDQGKGLVALPISSFLRHHIPPYDDGCLERLDEFFRWLAEEETQGGKKLIAIYGDDMEKCVGCCGWSEKGPAHYETLLKWLIDNPWVRPVRLNEWAAARRIKCQKPIEVGSYVELSSHFGAGEGYDTWYYDPQWEKYRHYFGWSEGRVIDLGLLGADQALLELAWKHLLVSGWETAWHTPPYGVHGGEGQTVNEPTPWSRAVASHSRHAAVIAEAAYWMKHKEPLACAYLQDIDNDGQDELILKNETLFAVFSPACGGRLVYLFNVGSRQGKMVIGNPSDDWNWMEELNGYMKAPPNHPGALADAGFEDDRYEAAVSGRNDDGASAVLVNRQPESRAFGLQKTVRLGREDNEIEVTYHLPSHLPRLSVVCGLSPDYLHLLRNGRRDLKEIAAPLLRGFANNGVSVWVRLDEAADAVFDNEAAPWEFGHGCVVRVNGFGSPFTLWTGTRQTD